ncbi:methyltransferase domain-containing protein, partial [Chloroflexota bacterium]
NIEVIYSFEINEKVETFIKERLNRTFSGNDLSLFRYISNKSKDHISIDLGDESIDIINCFFRLEQFADKEHVLNEFHRVLAQNGKLLIIAKNPRGKRGNRSYGLERNWNRGPESSLAMKDYLSLFEKTSFTTEKVAGIGFQTGIFTRLILKALNVLKLNSFEKIVRNTIKRDHASYNINELHKCDYFIFDLIKMA